MTRLLIFTPTIDDLMRPETEASIQAQKTAVDYVWEVGRYNPYPGEKTKNVVAQYQRARELCLAGDYEAMLTVEHDMVIPPNAVQRLYNTDASVVYGVYMLRHGSHTLNAWQWINNRNIGMSLSLYPRELKAARARGWAEVSGVGWGCTLIRRQVLEQISIRGDVTDAGDIGFATDCLRTGHKMIARFDVPCDHIEPNGNVLKPYEWGGIVGRVYCLIAVTANVNGHSTPMLKDHYYTMDIVEAKELARAGYVQITNLGEEEEREQPDISAREMAINPKAATRSTRKAK